MIAADNLKAIGLMVISMLGFAIEDAMIKILLFDMPVGQVLMMIGAGGMVAFFSIANYRNQPIAIGALKDRWVFMRTLSELFGTGFFVTSLALVPLVTVSAIIQMAPLIVTMSAALILKEKVGPRRWAAIALGILGMVIILQPWNATFQAVSFLAVAGVVFLSLRDVTTRRIPKGVPTLTLATLGFGATLPAGFALSFFGVAWVIPTLLQVLILACCVLVGVLSYFAIINSMRIGEISAVTPFRYSRLIFGSIIGVLFFAEVITLPLVIGSLIIIATGLYTLWRERQLAVT